MIERLAQAVARPRSETGGLDDPGRNRVRVALFLATVAAFGAIYFPSLNRAMGPGLQIAPEVLIAQNGWSAVYSASPAECGADGRLDYGCLANPENPTLWGSSYNRNEPGHGERVLQQGTKPFWLGAEITPKQLERARELGATYLVLGLFNAHYRVWLDGELYLSGDGWHESHRLLMPMLWGRLAADKPLRIAIEVRNTSGTVDPDLLNRTSGGEGLFGPERLNSYLLFHNVNSRSRPLALYSSFFMLSLMFFIFWLPSRRRPEYFYLSLYALACAFNQARQFDLFWSTVDARFYQAMAVVLICYEMQLGLLLGMAFARVRRKLVAVCLGVSLGVPWVLVAVFSSTAELQQLKQLTRVWGAPVAYGAAALVCCLQAAYLHWRSEARVPHARKLQLLAFGIGLALLGWVGSAGWASSMLRAHSFLGLEQFVMLLFLAAIALREFKEQSSRARRTPVSEYHLREVLPDQVTGAIVVGDYKPVPGSELRQSATENENAIAVWRTHFYNAALRNGGTIIQHKGKEVVAFFDGDRCERPAEAALRALEEVERDSKLMDIEFKRRHQAFCFKASVVAGSIRPIWEEIGAGTREPYWEEAGSTTPFVDAARLLEMSPQALAREPSATPVGSLVVLRSALAAELQLSGAFSRARFVVHAAPVSDKHGQPHQLSVYLPGGEPAAASAEAQDVRLKKAI